MLYEYDNKQRTKKQQTDTRTESQRPSDDTKRGSHNARDEESETETENERVVTLIRL